MDIIFEVRKKYPLRLLLLFVCMGFDCKAEEHDTAYWRVQKKIEHYGENMTIVCNLNISLQQPGQTKRWYKEQKLISFNDITINDTKYASQNISDGMQLTILNVSPDDVNRLYYCEIGFYKSLEKNLSANMVFIDKQLPLNNSSSEKKLIVAGIIIGAGLIILVLFLLFIRRIRRQRFQPKRVEDNNMIYLSDLIPDEKIGNQDKAPFSENEQTDIDTMCLLSSEEDGSNSNQDQFQLRTKNDYKDEARSLCLEKRNFLRNSM